MKKIETVVEDVYKAIQPICKGEGINLSEKELNDFGEAMKNALKTWVSPYEGKKSNLRMSNVGRPSRQLWFDSKQEEGPSEFNAPTMIKFLYGHILEELVLFLVNLTDHKVTDQQKEVNVDGIIGHMDCKIDGEVIDIKSTSGFAFNKFKNGTLAENDYFGYMAQLSGYEEAEKGSKGGFLAINKETGELALYQPQELDKVNIKTRISKIKTELLEDTPPDYCYTPQPEGTSGNMKLHKQCMYCKHKINCWKDSNDGKGLRVFEYSKGLMFLTDVVREPKVKEVTNEWKKSKGY